MRAADSPALMAQGRTALLTVVDLHAGGVRVDCYRARIRWMESPMLSVSRAMCPGVVARAPFRHRA